jgi:hypothetical protein
MEIDELPENDERLLKKPEIRRDEHGRFEQHGAGLIKKTQNIKRSNSPFVKGSRGGLRAGAGRPRGSKNKISLTLKEMILGALHRLGGEEYLMKLAIENSSAFASLLGKVLPTTLQGSESDGGQPAVLTFRRVIVWPGGREEVQDVTPKQLPAPASHALPKSDEESNEHSNISRLEP